MTEKKGCGKELFEHPDYPELKAYCGDDAGYYCEREGNTERGLLKSEKVKEFIRRLKKELIGDTLAYGYKAYEEEGKGMSTMEICHREDCNSFVIKRIHKEIDKLAGDLSK